MISRLGLSCVFLLTCAGSLFLKFPGVTTIVAGTPDAISEEISAILEEHRFKVSYNAPDLDLQWMTGESKACHVMVAQVAPQGWHQALVTQLAGRNRLYFLFQGKAYDEQPVMRTRASYYWIKLNRYLGFNPPNDLVLAVIAAPHCEGLPLSELAEMTTG